MVAFVADDNFYSLPLTMQRNGRSEQAQSKSQPRSRSPVPPKLPPRDLHNAKPPLTLPEPDYDTESLAHTPVRSVDDMADLIYRHQTRNKKYIGKGRGGLELAPIHSQILFP